MQREETVGKNISLTASDGHKLGAYRADPKGKSKGGIVVIQEIFGVNGHVRDVTDRIAEQGYTAIAPALFDRVKTGVDIGYEEKDMQEGFGYMQKVGNDTPMKDIQAAADELRKVGKVGAIGFCWGGQLAWMASKSVSLDCSVGYYGIAVHQTLKPQPKVPVMLHFADLDGFVPKEAADEVRKAYPDMPIYNYPADHGFNCDRRGSYHEPSAKLAMDRTLQFFAKHVG
jgi:carboxymethylenebutenolidase